MESNPAELTIAMTRAFLEPWMPGARVVSITPMEGSFSNFTHLVTVDAPGEGRQQLVIRRYNPNNGLMAQKADIEFHTLAWLHGGVVPVPEPLRLDPDGAILGVPGFAMRCVPGKLVIWPGSPPDDPIRHAQKAAAMLAAIHQVPCDPPPPFLLDGNHWSLWFLEEGEMPPYLREDADGPAVWEAIRAGMPDFRQSRNVLHHGDYWDGNLLWDGDEISAVMDWEEAGCGEAGADVAYFLMGMYLVGHPEAAEAFLQTYARRAGNVEHLAFWKLAAAVRPMQAPRGCVDASPFRERFRAFVAAALRE